MKNTRIGSIGIKKSLVVKLFAICATLFLLLLTTKKVLAQESNNYNVVFVTDASNSMSETDPNNIRYKAAAQFANLLAEDGNYLGSVVFSTGIDNQQDLQKTDSQEVKDGVIRAISSVKPHGYTNIGEGLDKAVDMLSSQGNKDLPSVIIFLSDGNSAMASDDELKKSLNLKADALQKAREKGIKIYSVTLNANGEADTNEMKQISQATGGEFQEVKDAQDLKNVFNSFYNMIYGTSSVSLVDNTFPSSGKLETEFVIPNIGVKEVNIIINGNVKAMTVYQPDGKEKPTEPITSDSFSMIKIKDVTAGKWKLVTEGAPGNQIKINMVNNPNLKVEVNQSPKETVFNPKDPLTITAKLTDGKKTSETDNDYSGYQAQLVITDAYGKEIDSKEMTVKDGSFTSEYSFKEGTYHYQVKVKGNGISKDSDIVGPVVASSKEKTEEEKNNTPPEPVKEKIEKLVFTFPFIPAKYTLDLNHLAEDKQDQQLHYEVVSSSFIKGQDYEVTEDNKLKLTHFSLSKGSFDIKATDTGGLSTHIEVVVRTFNVGWIGLGLIFIGIAIFAFITYSLSRKSFYGDITIRSESDSGVQFLKKTKLRRGKLRLSAFSGLENVGLNMSKSYFQATGKKYIIFISNKPVQNRGITTKKVEIRSGTAERIVVNENSAFEVTFRSKLK